MDNVIYTIVRSKRNTVQIIVKHCEVSVHAPYGYPDAKIEKLVYDKHKWIERCISKQKCASDDLEFVKNHGYLLLFGERVANVGFQPDAKSVRRFYFNLTEILEKKLVGVSNDCGIKYTSIRFSDAKTLWGTCDYENNIRLNVRLSALPVRLIEYVMVHELAHTIQHNHSKAFWDAVASIMPDYKERRKELKKYSWILEVYR